MTAETYEQQLYNSLQVIHSKWASTKSLWNDPVALHFEAAYLYVVEQQTEKTLAEMRELVRVLTEAQKKVH